MDRMGGGRMAATVPVILHYQGPFIAYSLVTDTKSLQKPIYFIQIVRVHQRV